jgi:hypothetical protein
LGSSISIGTISAGPALFVTVVSVSADGLSELSPPGSGEDFLQAGTKHKNIASNTSTQTFAIEPKSFFIISFNLKNPQFYVIDETIKYPSKPKRAS